MSTRGDTYHVYENPPNHRSELFTRLLNMRDVLAARGREPTYVDLFAALSKANHSHHSPFSIMPPVERVKAEKGQSMRARIAQSRGHMVDDATIAYLCALFPFDPQGLSETLQEARAKDRAAWSESLEARMQQTQEPDEFVWLLAAWLGHGNRVRLISDALEKTRERLPSRAYIDKFQARLKQHRELTREVYDYLHALCPPSTRQHFARITTVRSGTAVGFVVRSVTLSGQGPQCTAPTPSPDTAFDA